MPIGSGIVYNTGDLILSQVSSSGTSFLETKIAAATSSLIYFLKIVYALGFNIDINHFLA